MKFPVLASLAAQLLSVSAGTVLWDGRFNDLSSSSDLNNWSWSNQVGPYQYYIHGSSPVTAYVNLSPSYKNPGDTGSKQGAKVTLDSTAYWNGQTMRRTELIPQTTAAINKGKVFYHFSLMRSDINPPAQTREHQIGFFESHFTELKAGWLSGAAGVWHNVAYEIDFTANTVGFWHSTGSGDLVQVVAPQSVSTSSNGADWHVGVLELPRDGYPDSTEDYYWSGVYIESGSITTSVSGPGSSGGNGGGSSSSSSSKPATSTSTSSTKTTLVTSTTSAKPTTTSTSPPPASTTTPGGCTAAHWAQCGGNGWTGCTTCASGTTCVKSNDWYSQCL